MATVPELKFYRDEDGTLDYIGVVTFQLKRDACDPERPAYWQLFDAKTDECLTYGFRKDRSGAFSSCRVAVQRRRARKKAEER